MLAAQASGEVARWRVLWSELIRQLAAAGQEPRAAILKRLQREHERLWARQHAALLQATREGVALRRALLVAEERTCHLRKRTWRARCRTAA